MALEKSVLMDDGVVRRYHKIFNIQHILDQATYIEVVSYQFSPDDGSTGVHTTLTHEFDDGLSFAEAYGWINSRPEFEEHTSDSETEIQELNSQLTDARSTIAEKDETIENQQTQIDDISTNLTEVSEKLNTAISVITDEQALTIPQVFPTWVDGAYYTVGYRVAYDDILYKCLMDHTSQSDWAPNVAHSLWTTLHPSEIDPELVEEWVQPDSTNPYMTGAKVTHNGSTWISTVDNNVWEPGVYGWNVM